MPTNRPDILPINLRLWRFADALESLVLRNRRLVWTCLIIFYLLSFNGLWRIGPDSGLYLAIARNIARGEGYNYMGQVNRLAYPGLPYLMAGLMKIAGPHALAIGSAILVAAALLSLRLSELLFRQFVRPGAALLATVFLACNYGLYENSFDILTDIPFLLGTIMVLLGGAYCGIMPTPRLDPEALRPTPAQKRLGWGLFPAGLLICAAMRPTFYLLAITVALAAFITLAQKRKLAHLLGGFAILLGLGLTYLLVTHADPRRETQIADIYEQAVSWHLSQALKDPSLPLSNAWQILNPEMPTAFLGYSMTYADPAITLALLIAAIVVLRRYPAGLIWIALTLAVQIVVGPVPRYMIPILPLLYLSWWIAASRLSVRWPAPAANLLTMAAYLLLLPGFVRCIGQTWTEQYQRPFLATYHNGSFLSVDDTAFFARKHLPPDAILVTPYKTERIYNFLADRFSFSIDQPIPENLRSRPLFAVYPESSSTEAAAFDARFTLADSLFTARTHSRRNGILQVRPITAIR